MSRRLGLALGGGGARGLAGSVMGAAKSVGADLQLIAKVLESVDLNDMLQVSDSTVREVQKIVGRSMVEYVRGSAWREEDSKPHDLLRLRELFRLLTAGKRFSDAEIPYAAVAANLETGERIVLREGLLCDAVVASTSVPGVFSPVAWEGQFLIDGGVVDKLPVDVVIDMGAEAVLAVDTGAPLDNDISTCLDTLLQTQRVTDGFECSPLNIRKQPSRRAKMLFTLTWMTSVRLPISTAGSTYSSALAISNTTLIDSPT